MRAATTSLSFLLLAQALAGCAPRPGRGAADAAGEEGASPAATSGGDSAHGAGKPGAPVRLDAEPVARAEVGVPLVVTARLVPGADLEELEVEVGVSAGLEWKPGAALPSGPHRSGERLVLELSVIPRSEGQHLLGITVTTRSHGERRARAFAIPIQVGEGGEGSAPAGTPGTDPGGQPILSLPAQEPAPATPVTP